MPQVRVCVATVYQTYTGVTGPLVLTALNLDSIELIVLYLLYEIVVGMCDIDRRPST